MKRVSYAEMACSVAQTLEVIGEWWSPLIIRDAMFGVTRFDDFQRRLGIARNVLTQRLDHLVERGVLERVPYQDHPVRYDYRLTPAGRDLGQVLNALRQWGDRWRAPDGPPVEMVHRACGHVVQVVPTCSECGEPLGPGDLRAQPGPGARDPNMLPSPAAEGLKNT
jgi:DNA-binding HxlR family transcriptional regulator